MLHWPLLLHVLVIHRYVTLIWYTNTWIFTGIRALIIYIYSCSMYFLHVIMLHDCFLLLLLIFSLLIFLLLDMSVVDTRCMKLSATLSTATGATSRIPHLLYIVSHYLISWYQQSSCPIIVLLVPCTVLVLDILCSSNIMNIT